MGPACAVEGIQLSALCPVAIDTPLTHNHMKMMPQDLVTTMPQVMIACKRFIDTEVSTGIWEVGFDRITDYSEITAEDKKWVDFGLKSLNSF